MKDRLSLDINNGQSGIREAVTVMRNGGTTSQSGLFGITNAVYTDGQEPYLPQTIFNVQSTGDSNIRFSSGPSVFRRSCLELLGNGNSRASGLHFSYDPELDNAFIPFPSGYYGYGGATCVDPSGTDNTVADISLIRPSGTEGLEFSHISISERGYVGVGKLRVGETRFFNPVAPLTVVYACNAVGNSGTIAQHEQESKPTAQAAFGQTYVKPYVDVGHSQALFFLDDEGNETNLVVSDPSGLIFGHNGNTYGGWYTPRIRAEISVKANNTLYGWAAGHNLSKAGSVSGNTIIGYHAGVDLEPTSSGNTLVGCGNLSGFTLANNNIIVGRENSNGGNNAVGGMDDSILIGNGLYQGSVPSDGTLAIGISSPVIVGKLTGSKSISVVDATLSVLNTSNSETVFSSEPDGGRYTNVIDIVDLNNGGSDPAENNLEFRFTNGDGLSMTLFEIDPSNGPMTNSYSFATPSSGVPYARLDADLKIRGAVRFQDGSSLSGLSALNVVPLTATSGVYIKTTAGVNRVVLDYVELGSAEDVATEVRTDNTYLAVQVDGTLSRKVGKMSLQEMSDYISGGSNVVTQNCNILISNSENRENVNSAGLSRTVMIGCDVATGASGWNHGVIIGSEAGVNATISNPGFGSDYSAIFIGHRAGYDSDNLENVIAIGTNAGNNSDTANGSIFIGSNAGLANHYKNSIGIGEHALRGNLSGSGNLEIVAGIDDNNRLMYNASGVNGRFNIMNVFAGRGDRANVSIGVPRLSPTAPLEVRRDSTVHDDNGNDYIQTWYCDGVLVANVDCNGNFSVGSGTTSAYIEGILQTTLASGSIATPGSGRMSVYSDGVDTGTDAWVSNRDSTLNGISSGTYIVATRIGSEYRPIWVGCS